jgi:hypothetical protein
MGVYPANGSSRPPPSTPAQSLAPVLTDAGKRWRGCAPHVTTRSPASGPMSLNQNGCSARMRSHIPFTSVGIPIRRTVRLAGRRPWMSLTLRVEGFPEMEAVAGGLGGRDGQETVADGQMITVSPRSL